MTLSGLYREQGVASRLTSRYLKEKAKKPLQVETGEMSTIRAKPRARIN